MILGLRQAAKAAGVSRQTLYRYAKDGRISTVTMENGQQGVDTSELMRVFGALRPDSEAPKPETAPETVTGLLAETAERHAVAAELAIVKAALDNASRELEAAKERENRLLGIIESQGRLLEDKRPQEPPGKPQNRPPWALLLVLLLAVILAGVAVLVPR